MTVSHRHIIYTKNSHVQLPYKVLFLIIFEIFEINQTFGKHTKMGSSLRKGRGAMGPVIIKTQLIRERKNLSK